MKHPSGEKSGRELDAMVAEKVMEEPKPTGNVPDGVLAGVITSGSGGGNWIGTTTGYTAGDEPVWLPKPYSTEIAPAFEAVEKLRPRFYLSLEVHLDHVNACFCPHGEVFRSDGTHMYQGEAIAAPHAICLAALKAVEGALEELKGEEDD